MEADPRRWELPMLQEREKAEGRRAQSEANTQAQHAGPRGQKTPGLAGRADDVYICPVRQGKPPTV